MGRPEWSALYRRVCLADSRDLAIGAQCRQPRGGLKPDPFAVDLHLPKIGWTPDGISLWPATATARPPRNGPMLRYFSSLRAVKSTWAQSVAADRRQMERVRIAGLWQIILGLGRIARCGCGGPWGWRLAFCATRNQFLIRLLVSLYCSGPEGRRSDTFWISEDGGGAGLAICAGRNQFLVTHLDSRSPGGFPNGGWDPRKCSCGDAVLVTSGRDTWGVLNLRRAWGEAEAGIQSAQVAQVFGEILWRCA